MKSQGFARLGLASLVMGLAALQAGCAGKYTGGGWIDSADGSDKATASFNMHAEDGDGDGEADEFKGQFEYQDHGSVRLSSGAFFPKGIKAHGDVTGGGFLFSGYLELFFNGIRIPGVRGDWGQITGTYTPQPKNLGPGGTFLAVVSDGDPFDPDDDWFSILFETGVYAGYANNGYLLGGNIKYHPEEE